MTQTHKKSKGHQTSACGLPSVFTFLHGREAFERVLFMAEDVTEGLPSISNIWVQSTRQAKLNKCI